MDTISALIPEATKHDLSTIGNTLTTYLPAGILGFLAESKTRIRPLKKCERYDAASPALKRLGIDVDSWPAPPAGLFVVEERTVYLRSRSVMTQIHEVAHSLDAALGGGVYRSGLDPVVRSNFASCSAFVTPYAATGIDEYFAECVRAYVGANDAASCWPQATRARLARIDKPMHDYIEAIFAKFAPAAGEQIALEFGGSG